MTKKNKTFIKSNHDRLWEEFEKYTAYTNEAFDIIVRTGNHIIASQEMSLDLQELQKAKTDKLDKRAYRLQLHTILQWAAIGLLSIPYIAKAIAYVIGGF